MIPALATHSSCTCTFCNFFCIDRHSYVWPFRVILAASQRTPACLASYLVKDFNEEVQHAPYHRASFMPDPTFAVDYPIFVDQLHPVYGEPASVPYLFVVRGHLIDERYQKPMYRNPARARFRLQASLRQRPPTRLIHSVDLEYEAPRRTVLELTSFRLVL